MGTANTLGRLQIENASASVVIADINKLRVPDTWLSITGPDEATLEANGLVIDVRDFGAVCDDVTDDSAAIQAAIDSLGTTATTRGGPKIVISGPCAIASTVLINRKSIVFSGLGWGRQGSTGTQSYLRWIGSAGSPMLRLQNVQGVSVRDLHLIGNTAAKPSCGISLFQETGFGQNQNTIHNVAIGGVVDGTAAGVGITSGILFEGLTANNDTWFMDNILIDGFSEYAIRQNSVQNVACSIRNLTITNGRDGVYIVSSIYGHAWSFGAMSGTLFILPNTDDQEVVTLPQVVLDLLIVDQAPSRFIEFLGNGTVSINGGYYKTGSNTASDGKIITHEVEGNVALRLTDVQWSEGLGSPTTDPYLSFRKATYANRTMDTIVLDGVPFLTGGPNANGLDAESRGILDNKFVFWRPDRTSATEYGAIAGATNYIGGDFGGGENYDPSRFDIPARLRRPPSANPQAIALAANTIVADRSLLLIKNVTGASITLTSTPTIANGATGEVITMMNVGTHNIVLQDQGTLAGSNLRLSAPLITLAPRQSIELTYIATSGAGTFTLGDWVQTGGATLGDFAESGTAFPTAPATKSRFFRTDRDIEYYYDGTRWLSTQLYTDALPWFLGVQPFAATAGDGHRLSVPYAGTYDLWLVEAQLSFNVLGGTALGASHKWVTIFQKLTAAGAATTVATFNVDSGASSTWRTLVVAIGALLGTTHLTLAGNHAKTGTPGTYYVLPRIVYRLVG